MMITIKDIARKMNLSTSTVSRALNNHPAISEKTRRSVMTCVEQMNYQPNRNAQNLVNQSSSTIGMLVPDISDSYFSRAAVGVEEVLSKRGYELIYYNANRSLPRILSFLDLAKQYQFGGVFITPDQWTDALIDRVHKLGRPVISLRRKTPYVKPEIPYVDSDHYTGFKEATQYLISLGHQHIGLITAKTMIYDERQSGYEEIIRANGLTPHIIRFDTPVNADVRNIAGFEAAEKLMKKQVTAIIATDDRFSIGVIQYLQQHALRIPQDVAVMGCDDRPESALYPFHLSSVRQDIIELGRNAARLMLRMIENPEDQPVSISLKPTLIIRGTTEPHDA